MSVISDNKTTIGAGIAGVAIGTALGSIAGYAIGKRRTKRKKTKSKTRKRKYKRSHSRKRQKKPYTAGKRKDTSRRRIRYTKNNQPYIILASGKARFISKRSVRSSRKRKGGRY
jgi:membrane protein YqaA with SNARE-associated domain